MTKFDDHEPVEEVEERRDSTPVDSSVDGSVVGDEETGSNLTDETKSESENGTATRKSKVKYSSAKKTGVKFELPAEAQQILKSFEEAQKFLSDLVMTKLSPLKVESYLPDEDHQIVQLRPSSKKRFLVKEEDFEIVPNPNITQFRKSIFLVAEELHHNAVHLLTAVKMLVPPCSCGNNFGVEVQGVESDLTNLKKRFNEKKELVTKEIDKLINQARDFIKDIDNIDYTKRAGIISKFLKDPQEVHKDELRELDRRFFVVVKHGANRLKSSIQILLDIVNKNADKLVNPRGQDHLPSYMS